MTPEQDKRWWVLKGRIDKMEIAESKYASFPEMVKTNHLFRAAVKDRYGKYPEWTEEHESKHKAKLKRMNSIRFTWVVELTNLMVP